MNQLFRQDNTQGYTDEQLAELNAEWEARAKQLGLTRDDLDYDQAAKEFADEVARR